MPFGTGLVAVAVTSTMMAVDVEQLATVHPNTASGES